VDSLAVKGSLCKNRDGLAFVHSGGTLAKELRAGEVLKVDTGCIVFTKDVDYDIEFIGGIKNSIFGGEGLFYATLRGPGTVYIQSLPFSRLADRIIASAPKAGGNSRGEGSVLGGLGNLLMEIIVINFIILQYCNHKLDLPTRTGSHHNSYYLSYYLNTNKTTTASRNGCRLLF
jgi:hypothetical protein